MSFLTGKNNILLLVAAGVLLLASLALQWLSAPSASPEAVDAAGLAEGPDALATIAAELPLDMQRLKAEAARFESRLAAQKPAAGAAGAAASAEALEAAWAPGREAMKTLTAQAESYTRVATNLRAIADLTPPVTKAYNDALAGTGRSVADGNLINRQLVALYRVETTSRQVLAGSAGAEAAAQQLAAETTDFLRGHRALVAAGVIDRATADYVGDALATIETAIAAIGQDIQAAAQAQPAAAALATAARASQAPASALATALGAAPKAEGGSAVSLPSLLCGLLSLLLMAVYGVFSGRAAKSQAAAIQAGSQTEQEAIVRLLDEITNLANGDLTGELTVTADFTGNIADSLNYTVQTLRGLVGTINNTSVEIAAAASSTTERVEQMSSASEGQAREIVRTAQAITYASRSLEDVASRAEKLAEQAKGSVDTAHNGAATVGRTIAGMTTLREQIQDTAKRIKRLGESSQEIGNIIEFINDIAEQTNTLALNASIQAAMAGESGRGFAVVADQVKQLAERAGSATRQIESLIKTIQTDTQEAITSMERSTANVVGGAKSAEEAGLSLTRIEASSQELARVMQDIAAAARNQSAETTKLAGAMQDIREISVQTSSTAHKTVESVGELNTLSAKLRESVAGFKLPADEAFG